MLIQPIRPHAAVAFQDVLVVVLRTAQDEAVLHAADEICTFSGGRATALLASPFESAYFVGHAYGGAAGEWNAIVSELRQDAVREGKRLRERLAKASATMEFRTTENDPLMSRQNVLMSARHADISLFTLPSSGPEHTVRSALIEAALFESGRPVMIVPPHHRRSMAFKNVVVAWNASREAARAVGDAAGILDGAERVTIVTVDASPATMGPGEAPGEDIAAHLAHRGVKVELRNVDGMGRPASEAILETARAVGADLIVLGAYGHARAREFVFGGVTKDLLRNSEVPIFMSH